MKTEKRTYGEMEEFVRPLLAEKKFAINIRQLPENAGYSIEWIEHKNYTAFDGQEFPDEIWIAEDGRINLVQDLEEGHVRNILRMILRQEREARDAVKAMRESLAAAIENGTFDAMLGGADEDEEGDELPETAHISTTTGKLLH